MAAHNVAPYIGAAIESVIAQTEPDWELLATDDGSSDDTAAIVGRYAARDARVRLLQQSNAGISTARNQALGASSGRFLAILDADDLWAPTFLERQLEIFARDPDVDVVSGNGWFLGGRRHGVPARPWPDRRPTPTLASILGDETAVFIMSVFRRRVYETIGGFDEALRTNEDYDFWLRAAVAGFRFARNDEPLAHYRRRDDSLSASEVRMITGVLRVCEKTRPLLRDRPGELEILNRQVERFERELLAAQAHAALGNGNVAEAAERLADLYERGGRLSVKLASVMAKWTPGLFARAYQFRRTRQEAAS
jgi:glycosyltransferase involved in cell wall biosynthesis